MAEFEGHRSGNLGRIEFGVEQKAMLDVINPHVNGFAISD
jgi:hypothetical protein